MIYLELFCMVKHRKNTHFSKMKFVFAFLFCFEKTCIFCPEGKIGGNNEKRREISIRERGLFMQISWYRGWSIKRARLPEEKIQRGKKRNRRDIFQKSVVCLCKVFGVEVDRSKGSFVNSKSSPKFSPERRRNTITWTFSHRLLIHFISFPLRTWTASWWAAPAWTPRSWKPCVRAWWAAKNNSDEAGLWKGAAKSSSLCSQKVGRLIVFEIFGGGFGFG